MQYNNMQSDTLFLRLLICVHQLHLVFSSAAYPVYFKYHKVPKFSDARKHSKIQIKWLSQRVFCPKYADGLANSEDTDQTAPLGAV